jgi:hypothetical protein
LCTLVSMYTSHLSLQTMAVKSSFVMDWMSQHFNCLFGGSQSGGIPFLLSHTVP